MRGEGVGPVVWFSIDTVCDPSRIADMFNASLLNQPPDNSPRPSGQTYALVAQTLGTLGGTARLSAGPALFAYQFSPTWYGA